LTAFLLHLLLRSLDAMSVNLNEIDLDRIHDPTLREQVRQLIEEQNLLRLNYALTLQELQFKSHFLARISHEIRSPLSGIIGSHQLILGDLCENTDEERDFLKEANKAALTLVSMLDSLLRISRFEAGRVTFKPATFTAEYLLQAITEPMRLESLNRGIPLKTICSDLQLSIQADPRVLTTLLVDVLELALDFTTEGEILVGIQAIDTAQTTIEIYIDSHLNPADLTEPTAWIDECVAIAQQHQQHPRTFIPSAKLSPAMRLTLDMMLLTLMGGKWLALGELALEELAPEERALGEADSPTPALKPGFSRLRLQLPPVLPSLT